MKSPTIEKYIPNLLLILLFESGRKHGLGLWIILISVVLFVADARFDLNALQAGVTLGSFIFAGGNVADQWLDLKKKKVERGDVQPVRTV